VRSAGPPNKALEPDREPGFAGSGPHSRAVPILRCGAHVATGSRPLSLVVRRRRFARANLTPVGFSLPRPSFRDFADLMAPASPNYVGCELLIEFARLRFGSAVGAASAASARRTLGTTSGSRCAPSRASRRSPSTPMKSAACLARRAAPAVAVVLSLAHATPGRGGPRPPARVGPATNGAHRQPAHCTPPYAPSTPQRIGDEGHRNIERAHSAPCLSPCSDSPSPRVPILPAHGVASSVAFSLACAAPLPVGVLLVVTPGVASLTLGALRCAPRFVSSMRPGVQRFCPRPPRHGSPRAITAANNPVDRGQDDCILLRPNSLAAQPDPPPSGGHWKPFSAGRRSACFHRAPRAIAYRDSLRCRGPVVGFGESWSPNNTLEPDREPGFAGSGPHSRARPVSTCGARVTTGSRPLSLVVRRR
jgi:hypothetical protein